jgi:hypothetical protein
MTGSPAQLPFLMLCLIISKGVGDFFNYSVFDHQMMLKVSCCQAQVPYPLTFEMSMHSQGARDDFELSSSAAAGLFAWRLMATYLVCQHVRPAFALLPLCDRYACLHIHARCVGVPTSC